ncbi:MAG: glycosyltransferase family 2 protein [Flavobacteriales bacterium]
MSQLFSILVANYNNGHFFKDCWKTILEQTYQNFEVIIVDDCSIDDSIELIKKIIKGDTRVKIYINEENKGCGYTKRKCVALGTGEIMGFVDPDDGIVSKALEIMVEKHNQNPDIAMVYSRLYCTDLDLKIQSKGETLGKKIPEGYSYLTYGRQAISHFTTFKKKFYDLTEGINPTYKRAVDQDLYYKLEEIGSCLFLDKYLYLYRINNNSISANDNWYKARHWNFVAISSAYERRKNNNSIINFTEKEYKKCKCNYYRLRALVSLKDKKICQMGYFVYKMINAFPGYAFSIFFSNLKQKI